VLAEIWQTTRQWSRTIWELKRDAVLLSVVIPTLNAAQTLPATLASLGGAPAEVLVVDGGSVDDTVAVAAGLGAQVLMAPRGRGAQLAAGSGAATQAWLLLLHADTQLGAGWQAAVGAHVRTTPDRAGYFHFTLDSNDPRARRLERAVAWRCRTFALPYGDQALLIHRDLLRAAGGVQSLPLMEDVDLVRRLGRHRLVALAADAITSAEKWQRDGWYRRSLRNLACLSLYFAGVPPRLIAWLY
jgi:rSAM/selenodomain-associated transferase 2